MLRALETLFLIFKHDREENNETFKEFYNEQKWENGLLNILNSFVS